MMCYSMRIYIYISPKSVNLHMNHSQKGVRPTDQQHPVNEDAEQVHAAQKQIRAEVHQTNCQKITSHAKEVRGRLPQNRQAIIKQCCEDDASLWITAIPVTDFGFKQAFRDSLCLEYVTVPVVYPSASIMYFCSKGAFPIIRHNRIRDLLADFLTEVCPCVSVEPVLQPLSGEQFQLPSTNVEDNARILGQEEDDCLLWSQGVQCPCSL